jgi:CubicO group peptidase (beta-lactamase class C family)
MTMPMREFREARAVLERGVEDHAFPGAAFGVWSGGSVVGVAAAGWLTYERTSSEVTTATIYDLASVSKVMATTALAMRLWQRGLLDLELPVGELLPEFLRGDDPRRKAVTVHMLLAHTSGLPAHRKLYVLPQVESGTSAPEKAARALDACIAMPLTDDPGTRAEYSDIGFIVLGQVLERVAGETLEALCEQEVFGPLGLADTCFRPAAELRPRIAPTRDWEWRYRVLEGEVQDENCALLGGVAGHAGVFSTVGDVLRFAGALLTPGDIFTAAAVERFTRREDRPPGTSRTLGWDTPTTPSQSGRYFSTHSVGHLGYSGTALWIDLERRIAVALLTNRAYTEGGPANTKIQQVRPAFYDAVMEELLAG